jgi:putative sterol carrier protein
MAASAREFFESIPTKLDPQKLRGETMSYRFDIEQAGSWKIDVDDGVVSVAESTDPADCVIRMKEDMLVKMIEGRQNPATAFMLGKIKVDGDLSLAMKLKDFF